MTTILLDENLDFALASFLPSDLDVEVTTVQLEGWRGRVNGELFQLAARAGINVIITKDKKMLGQHNERTLPLPVIVLAPSARHGETLETLMADQVPQLLRQRLDNRFHIVGKGPAPMTQEEAKRMQQAREEDARREDGDRDH